VLHVLYLVFSEGDTASEGETLTVPALSREAIRLTRWLHRLLPDDDEVTGLLALMLLTDARRAARTWPDGSLVPLAEQDRQQWDQAKIAEGVALISAALPQGAVGPYQLQAAIAAVHDEAATMAETDWPQILGLYDLLELTAPNPFTALNRAVALAMVRGRRPVSKWSRRSRRTSGWPGITGSSRSGRTCASWPATARRRRPTTSPRRAGRPACPSAATWPSRPRG
jgi:predicted RNA polymerase sigma factor